MRRLADKIADAHRHAVEQGKQEIAELLLRALEIETTEEVDGKDEKRSDLDVFNDAMALHDRIRPQRTGR